MGNNKSNKYSGSKPWFNTGMWNSGMNEQNRCPQCGQPYPSQQQQNRSLGDPDSPNWSGYIREGGPFWDISGAWTVPVIPSRPSRRFGIYLRVTIWIGIGQSETAGLIQIGTGAKYINDSPYYYAWYEVFPNIPAETQLDPQFYPIDPGDYVSAEIYQGETTWVIQLTNITRNWTFSDTVNYNGSQNSAEFIVERPTMVGSNPRQYYPLADYGTVPFDLCLINTQPAAFNVSEGWRMVNERGLVISTPSVPVLDGFAVAYGRFAPPPPSPR